MMPSRFLVSALTLAALTTASFAGITFGPIRAKAGESVRLVTYTDTVGGTIQRKVSGKSSAGTVLITRERDLVWTFRDPAADGTRRGMVKVNKLSATSKVVVDGKTENNADSSPLTGKMFAMSKSPKGDWQFELDGSVPLTRVGREIDELKVYLKRDWYPAREVNLGDSWEFDPSWIKLIIEKDFPKAQTIGTMRLRQLRSGLTSKTAVIDITVRSTGADFKADGSTTDGSVNLTGQVTVNLNTMLDERLELKGTVTTHTSRRGDSTQMTLPIHLVVSKTFTREP